MGLPLDRKLLVSKKLVVLAVVGALLLLFGSRILVVQLPTDYLSLKHTAMCLSYAAAGNVRAAQTELREERARVRSERDAFDEFGAFVQQMPAAQPSTSRPPTATVTLQSAQANQLQRVRETYRKTVMAVPHYDQEYNDTVAESMAAELGSDLTAQLQTDGALTPMLKGQLLQAASKCRRERTSFLETLADEADTLETVKTTIEEVASRLECVSPQLSTHSFRELIAIDDQLCRDEDRCEKLLTERQQQRVSGHASIGIPRSSVSDLQSYLYHSLPVTYPVLADTTAVVDRVQQTRHRVIRELTWRF